MYDQYDRDELMSEVKQLIAELRDELMPAKRSNDFSGLGGLVDARCEKCGATSNLVVKDWHIVGDQITQVGSIECHSCGFDSTDG